MKQLLLVVEILALAAGAAVASAQQPSIASNGIFNAASYAAAGLPNGGIARGSMFVVFGTGLGPARLVQVASYPLPSGQGLAGTSIEISVGGTVTHALMIYTSASQAAAVLPSRVPAGTGTLTVSYNGKTSAPAPIRVVERTFGLFTRNQAGSGQATVQNWYPPGSVRLNSIVEAAKPGQVGILWGTGLGAVSGDEAAGPPVQQDMADVDVKLLVGGRPATILYRGRSGYAGIDQINFKFPQGMTGCQLPLAVHVGGVLSNFGAVAVMAQGGACSDPASFPGTETSRIKDEVRAGAIELQRTVGRITDSEGQVESFTRDWAEGGVYHYTNGRFLAAHGYFDVYNPLGTCRVDAFLLTGEDALHPDDPTPKDFLDAGAGLNVSGPNGNQVLTNEAGGEYEKELGGGLPGEPQQPPYLSPGIYTLDNGAGGRDVGPFRTTVSFPAPLTWTNRDIFRVVDRSKDMTVTWNGANASQDFVVILGSSTDYGKNIRATFTCTARADAGKFTVPAMVVSALPASGPWHDEPFPTGLLVVGTTSQLSSASFTAPGADFGFFVRMHLEFINVTFE